jgi:hypothetical protein
VSTGWRGGVASCPAKQACCCHQVSANHTHSAGKTSLNLISARTALESAAAAAAAAAPVSTGPTPRRICNPQAQAAGVISAVAGAWGRGFRGEVAVCDSEPRSACTPPDAACGGHGPNGAASACVRACSGKPCGSSRHS